MPSQPVRIANFSGYFGDQYSALDDVLAGDPVDVLIGDYLAEITLALLAARHQRRPGSGYVTYAVEQLRPHLATIAERGLKVVTNAGGFDPGAMADALRAAAAEAGVTLRVAHIEGDNILDELPRLEQEGHRFDHLDTGAPLSAWGARPVAANAYLGGWGIAAALEQQADIVVTGRVSDASLVLGPAAWWHGWDRSDWDRLAGGVAAGHVIECGPHATGGNFSGFTELQGMTRLSFPIAEIAEDGSSVITKHAGTGGAVTTDTVTAQLVYEIQGPRYLNPDVTVLIDSIQLTQEGPDRVRMSGIQGAPPPPSAKVALFAPIGFHTVAMAFVTAPNVEEKVALLRAQIAEWLPAGIDTWEVTPLGRPRENPASQWEATVPVRIMVTARDRADLEKLDLGAQLGSLYLRSVPGFFMDTLSPLPSGSSPRIDYWPGLLPSELVPHRAILEDGTTIDVAPVPGSADVLGQPEALESASPLEDEPTREVELGVLVNARSGDKGGNSNVGLWVADAAAYDWFRQWLSADRFRALMPEAADLELVRHELPHLRAVHVVIRGLLGSGGSSNLRVDQVGKAVGEYLRARRVEVPIRLLDRDPR
ncbi:acyclic terpene utilization AtuA family protein [Nocardioides insulae]|uniref:acyclic terpene utilization AtuA family protein n=1 Tax=Nocardioides insulae TaxID=394734 RepID=UPI00041678A2|nr:acyclic terpene utilization AtuA family protein [Nocardioides insulae]